MVITEDYLVGEYIKACMYCGSSNIEINENIGGLIKHKCNVCGKINILTKRLKTKYDNSNTYKNVYIGKMATRRNRYVASRQLKRKLRLNEIVHHINFNKSDDRKSNLDVMANIEHTIMHKKFNKIQIELVNRHIVCYDKIKKEYYINPKLDGVDLNETKMQ